MKTTKTVQSKFTNLKKKANQIFLSHLRKLDLIKIIATKDNSQYQKLSFIKFNVDDKI